MCMRDVLVDELLILYIDQRSEIQNARSQQCHTPKGKDFDEVVRNECCGEGLHQVSSSSSVILVLLTAVVTGTFSAKRIR